MSFRIGGLFIAAALCVLVILVESDSHEYSSQPKESYGSYTKLSRGAVAFQLRPSNMHSETEIVLCAKVGNPKLLKEVKFHPTDGKMSPHSPSASQSTFNGNGKVTVNPVRLRPGCEFYKAPKVVSKKGKEVSVHLVLNKEAKDTIHIRVSP